MSIKLEVAQKLLLAAVNVTGTERVNLEDCWQRVLAETIKASTDYPPFDRSPLDGYAIIADEIKDASIDKPIVLQKIGMVAAGEMPQITVTSGTACRIMTGAPLPAGATGVIRQEDTDGDGNLVKVFGGVSANRNICFQAEEFAKGEEMIPAGSVINMGIMGMLALLGITKPLVYKKLRVGILATGNEIVPIEAPLSGGMIRNSNSYMLAGQVREAGANPVLFGIAADDVREICSKIGQNREFDVIMTTGGASVGDYDLIGEVFSELGIEILFGRTNMKPGMPVLAGIKDGKLYMGLSGNPAAAGMAFEQLVRPALRKIGGYESIWRPILQARMVVPFDKGRGPKRFVWARYWQQDGELVVKPLPLQGKGMMKSTIHANCLIIIPEDCQPLQGGETVEVLDIMSTT